MEVVIALRHPHLSGWKGRDQDLRSQHYDPSRGSGTPLVSRADWITATLVYEHCSPNPTLNTTAFKATQELLDHKMQDQQSRYRDTIFSHAEWLGPMSVTLPLGASTQPGAEVKCESLSDLGPAPASRH